jgi:hypothetical protein
VVVSSSPSAGSNNYFTTREDLAIAIHIFGLVIKVPERSVFPAHGQDDDIQQKPAPPEPPVTH